VVSKRLEVLGYVCLRINYFAWQERELMLLKDATTKFLGSYIGLASPATHNWYAKKMKPLSALDQRPIHEITTDDLQTVWLSLAKRNARWENHPSGRAKAEGSLSPFTLEGYVRCWRRFFNWLIDQEYFCDNNPALKLRRPPLPDLPPKAVTTCNLVKLLEAAKGNARDYAMVCWLADTNARVGGTAGMLLQDVDFKTKKATVREKGKGGKGKARTVYLSVRTIQALQAYLRERLDSDSDHVFVGKRGPLTEGGIYLVLKRLARKARVRGRYNPHAFRHGWARGAIENGADLGSVADLMGNSMQVTQKFYARWDDNELQAKHRQVSWLPKEDEPD
jgi:integrase